VTGVGVGAGRVRLVGIAVLRALPFVAGVARSVQVHLERVGVCRRVLGRSVLVRGCLVLRDVVAGAVSGGVTTAAGLVLRVGLVGAVLVLRVGAGPGVVGLPNVAV